MPQTGINGHKTLTGGSGYDFLIGGPNDTLIAGTGNNTFVLNQGFGKETVANFNPNQDQLAFNHALFTQDTAAFVLSQTHDTKAGAVIVADPHDTVTLVGVTVAQLQAAQTTNWIHFLLIEALNPWREEQERGACRGPFVFV
jgi:Ca2+-binding RTX toxin-like protein